MPSIKWRYLLLSYFMLVSLFRIWHAAYWHREAHQRIYSGGRWVWWWWLWNYDPRTGRLVDLFGGLFHVTWVRVSPLSSGPGNDWPSSTRLSQWAVNEFPTGMLTHQKTPWQKMRWLNGRNGSNGSLDFFRAYCEMSHLSMQCDKRRRKT